MEEVGKSLIYENWKLTLVLILFFFCCGIF